MEEEDHKKIEDDYDRWMWMWMWMWTWTWTMIGEEVEKAGLDRIGTYLMIPITLYIGGT